MKEILSSAPGSLAQLVRAVALGDRSEVSMWTVYILKSEINKRLYTGSTNNLTRRLAEHNSGQSKYTRLTRPFKLVCQETYTTRIEARRRELFLKTGKGREIVKSLIEGT